jgi:hypothetical protein
MKFSFMILNFFLFTYGIMVLGYFQIQDKFRLDLSDEEAVLYLQGLIDVSLTAIMPALVDTFRKFAQWVRS